MNLEEILVLIFETIEPFIIRARDRRTDRLIDRLIDRLLDWLKDHWPKL